MSRDPRSRAETADGDPTEIGPRAYARGEPRRGGCHTPLPSQTLGRMDRAAGERRHLQFRIRAAGRVGERCTDGIGAGLEQHQTEGDTLPTEPLVDQSQPHGIHEHLRQLGIAVVQTDEAGEDSWLKF